MGHYWPMPSHRTRQRRNEARDDHAAALVEEFLDERGWTSYQLAAETSRLSHLNPDHATLTVSRRTIDRVLDGSVPNRRIRKGIALAMGVAPGRVWGPHAMQTAVQRAPGEPSPFEVTTDAQVTA